MTGLDRHGRPSLRWKTRLVFIPLFILITLITAFFAYAQTRHAFRHLLLPLAAHVTGATLDVREGQLSLRGVLEADGFTYEDEAAGVSIAAERLALKLAPWSFVQDGVLRIDNLELKQARLRVVRRPALAGVSIHEPEPRPTRSLPLLAVAILRARFEDVAFTIEGNASQITGRTGVEIDQLGPGRTGTVRLRTSFTLSRVAETEDLAGAMELALSVAAGPPGTPITWKGTNQVLVRSGNGGPLREADPHVMIFDQTLKGEWVQDRQQGRVSSTVAGRRQGTPLGSAEMMATMDVTIEPAVTNLALAVKGVTADTINLLLGPGAMRMHDGWFNARLEGRVEGTRTAIRGTAHGSQVQLRVSNREVSPAVDVSLQHAGAFDSATGEVLIDTLTVTLGDHARSMLSGSLDRPVSLRLDQAEGDTPPSGSVAAPAVWSLRLSPTEEQVWRPWLAFLGTNANALKGVSGGQLGGALTVTVHNQGALIEAVGRVEAGDVMLRSVHKAGSIPLGPLAILTEWKARMTGLRILRLDSLTGTVRLKGKQVAALLLTGTGQVAGKDVLTGVDGTMTLERLPGETFNLLLARWSSVRISQGQANGRVEFAVDGQRAIWHVDLHGQDVQLRLPDAHDAPPLDVLSQLDGEFDRPSQQLRMDRLKVQVVERRHPIVTVTLGQPLTLTLASVGEKAQVGGRRGPVTLGLRVDHLSVDQLRVWMALAGRQIPAPMRGGVLDVDTTVTLRGSDHIAVASRLDLEQVTFERASTPITIESHFTASVIDRSRLIVEGWDARALDGTSRLAQAHLAGSSSGFTGATELQLNVTADEPTELIARLGLLTNRQQVMVSGGRLAGGVKVTTAGSLEPLTIQTDFRSTDLTLHLKRNHSLVQTVNLHADLMVDAAWTVVDVRRLEVAEESAGARTGTMTANGRWPMTAEQGAITVKINEWDTGPLMEFFGFLPGRLPGPLPVTADMTITRATETNTLTLRGKESIGPMYVAVNGRPDEPTTLYLQHEVLRSDEETRVPAMTLAADRGRGQADRVSLSGRLQTGSQARLQLHGAVDALDADWYAALLAPASTRSSSGDAQTSLAAGPSMPLHLDVDVAIGTVKYRTLEIGAGRLVAKGDGHRMQATLEPTGLAGGTVQGSLTVVAKHQGPEFAWDLEGSALDLGAVTKAWVSEPESGITGRGQFTTAGTGRGQDETWRQRLNGTFVFDVADGQLIKVPVLEFLADQTRIDQFKDLGFQTFHGEFDVKDGWVNLKQVRANGPVAGIEAGGKIALDGRLDVSVEPKVGPILSKHVKIPCADKLAKTTEGFTVLPLAATVKGTTQAPSYGVDVTPGSMLERQAGALVGTIADLFTACRGGDAAQKFTEETMGAVKGTAKDLIKDLFGTKEKQ
jgi:hypothetical protein